MSPAERYDAIPHAASPEAVTLSYQERAREVLRDALAAVYSGAGMLEADAVLDHLDDRGYRIAPIGRT